MWKARLDKNVTMAGLLFLCFALFLCCPNAWAEIKKGTIAFGEAHPDTVGAQAATLPVAERDKTLVIGRVSDNPAKHYKRLKPMVDYVAAHLKDVGITRGAVLMAKDNEEMMRYLREGKVDWVTESPFSAIIFNKETGAEIMLRRWKRGAPNYYCIIFVRKDSGINRLEALKGKTIAFEDPGSTTSYFLPVYAMLGKTGLQLFKLPSFREKPPSEDIGYVFAGRDVNVATWVYKGLVDAGAFSNLDWENPEDVPYVFKKDLEIIYRSRRLPRQIELMRKDVNPLIKEKVKEILLDAHKDPEGRKALEAYHKTGRFDEFTGEAREELDIAKEMLRYLSPDEHGKGLPGHDESRLPAPTSLNNRYEN